ncbi:hypothetical protein [Thalassovita taeanensis]|nr:hypothetical protein [Thalassovita taeanensis]
MTVWQAEYRLTALDCVFVRCEFANFTAAGQILEKTEKETGFIP